MPKRWADVLFGIVFVSGQVELDSMIQSITDKDKSPRDGEPARGDREVAADAELRLSHAGYRNLRIVSCIYPNGVLVLRGCVPSYFLKQIAPSVRVVRRVRSSLVTIFVKTLSPEWSMAVKSS